MIIQEIHNSNRAIYEELAKTYGNIFNTTQWLKMFGDKVRLYGIYDKGNNLTGGFSLYKEERSFLKIYRDAPLTPTIGPFLRIRAKNPVAIMDLWKDTLASIADFIEQMPYSVFSVSLNKHIIDAQPFIWRNFKIIPRYTYILDLQKSLETIEKGMSSGRRGDLKKATKDGLAVMRIDDLNVVKSLVLKTYARQNIVASEYYLDKVLFDFGKNDNSFAFVTFRGANPIAASYCVYDKETAFYLLGGYDHDSKHHGAGALVVWEAINYARSLGLKCFDFEGSMVPQIEKYFRGFGGQLTPYYRVNKAKLPLEIILKFFKRDLF